MHLSSRYLTPALLLAAALIALSACKHEAAATQDQAQQKEKGLRILFIGNSLTYTNNLPKMLEKLFEMGNVKVDEIAMTAFPDYALEDHWNRGPDGPARKMLAEKKWDVVAMQQGPSGSEGRPSLIAYSKIFDELIKKAGGRSALYMVWPSKARFFDFDLVSESHQMAADGIKGLLFPAGEAWRAAWRRDSKLELYGGDGFHPSLLGTYLAALVMYEQLGKRDPRELPSEIPTSSGTFKISDEVAKILQEAAMEANKNFARE